MTMGGARSSVLVATIGAEPQVIAIALQLLRRREQLTAVDVLHTHAEREPVGRALADLDAMFARRPDWPDLHRTLIPAADLLLPEELDAFETILFQSLKKWKGAGCNIRLLLAGGRKTSAMVGMAVAQLLLQPWDRVLYLSSDENLRLSRRHVLEPRDKARLHEIPLLQDILRQGHGIAMQAATPGEARRGIRADHRRKYARFVESLTPTERKIAHAVATQTAGTAAMAAQLGLAQATVSNGLTRIYRKLEGQWGIVLHKGIKREMLRNILLSASECSVWQAAHTDRSRD